MGQGNAHRSRGLWSLFYRGVRGEAGRVIASFGEPFPAFRKAHAVSFYQSALLGGYKGRLVELRRVREAS